MFKDDFGCVAFAIPNIVLFENRPIKFVLYSRSNVIFIPYAMKTVF